MHQVQTRRTQRRWSTADLITCSRFALAAAVAVAALLDASRVLLGALVTVALLTDLVDGRLARATGTTSPRGARLDSEADALLILVLSAIVATDLGWWVIGIGAARYVFGAVFVAVPRLRTPPAPRPWCRTVAAATGITLAAVAVLPLPGPAAGGATAVIAALLAESFLHEGVDRWRAPADPVTVPYASMAAFAVVWVALAVPTRRADLTVPGLLRLPLEILVVAALGLLPWRRVRAVLAGTAGLLLGALLLIKVLDLSFQIFLDRNFDPVGDWSFFGSGVGVLGDSIGAGWAHVVAALAVLAAGAVLVGVPAAVVRAARVAARHRRTAGRLTLAFTALWALFLVTGLHAAPGAPVASTDTAALGADEVRLFRADLADTRAFGREIRDDPYAARAASDPKALLSGLAGKDVLVVFVESYGRVAVQGSSFSPGVDRVLDTGTRQLAAAGYQARTGFLTSPTFGGISWLAHSTFESGLWVNSQRRYRQLLGATRLTLTGLFARAGWNTVFDVPADSSYWTEGHRFYGFNQYYDAHNVGYRGPRFGYATIPDQYTLQQFRLRQLRPTHRRPVMAELDLVSSHVPWTPLPRIVPWAQLGDGSIFDAMPHQADLAAIDHAPVKQRYGQSIQYTWQALTSFLTTYPDPNLVLIVLGDHQPHSYVSGTAPGHDVPISVIAQDPAVMKRIAGWGWQPGLHPSPSAPVRPMSAFRDQFLAAFGS